MRTGENREKWDLYEDAVNEMLQKTNTTYAPGIYWNPTIKDMRA